MGLANAEGDGVGDSPPGVAEGDALGISVGIMVEAGVGIIVTTGMGVGVVLELLKYFNHNK